MIRNTSFARRLVIKMNNKITLELSRDDAELLMLALRDYAGRVSAQMDADPSCSTYPEIDRANVARIDSYADILEDKIK